MNSDKQLIPPMDQDSGNPLILFGKIAIVIIASAVLAHLGIRRLPDIRF